jgi:hypothetical protein
MGTGCGNVTYRHSPGHTHVPECPVQVEFCASQIALYILSKYVRIYKRVPLKTKLQHTGTLSGAAWPPHRLCYRPAGFFRHIHLPALSFQWGKSWSVSKKFNNLTILYSLKLHKSETKDTEITYVGKCLGSVWEVSASSSGQSSVVLTLEFDRSANKFSPVFRFERQSEYLRN